MKKIVELPQRMTPKSAREPRAPAKSNLPTREGRIQAVSQAVANGIAEWLEPHPLIDTPLRITISIERWRIEGEKQERSKAKY